MKLIIPDNCGNSPRSLLAIDVAINLASNDYGKLEPLLADDFTFSIMDGGEVLSRSELKAHMDEAHELRDPVDKFEVLTAFSHGKYAAVSSRAYVSNGEVYDSHDLYEFSSAGKSAKLRSVKAYLVGSR